MLDGRRADRDLVPAAQPAGRRGRVPRAVRRPWARASTHARPPPSTSRVLLPRMRYVRRRTGCCWATSAPSRGMTIAVGADHRLDTVDEHETILSGDDDLGKMVFRVEANEGQHGAAGEDRSPTTPRAAYPCASCPTAATGRSTGPRQHSASDYLARPARVVRRVLGRQRRRDRRADAHDRDPAGDPVQPVLAGPGQRPRRPAGRPGEGRHRLRLRGPLLLGHGDLRRPVPQLHPARTSRGTCCTSATGCSPRRGSGRARWRRAARCSRGARSTARRPRPTTRPAARRCTSTPTSPTR